MKLKKITLKNIRSYKEQEIEFPDGSLLLSGDVGSGKSSILLAIEYALFGLQPGQKGAALLRNSSTLGEVLLEFEIDGKEILIERRLRRSSKTVTNEYAAITIDGQKTESSITELKTKIINLLNYPHEFIKRNNILYRYTVYTPQEQMRQIISEDPETRLNILRHIFGMDKYKRIKENLSLTLSVLKEKSKLLQGEISTLDKDKQDLVLSNNLLLELKQRLSQKSLNLKQKTNIRKNIESQIQGLEDKIKEKQKFERSAEKTSVLLTIKQENLSTLTSQIQESKSFLQQKQPFIQEEYDSTLNLLSALNKKIQSLNSENIQVLGQMSSLNKEQQGSIEKRQRIFKIDICPTCLQDVNDTHKHNILNETESFLSKVKNTLSELEHLQTSQTEEIISLSKQKSQIEEKKLSLDLIKSKLEHYTQTEIRLAQLEKSKVELEEDLLLLKKHFNELKENISNFSKFDLQYKEKAQALALAQSEEKSSEIQIAEIKKEYDLTVLQISKIKDTIQEKEQIEKRLANLSELYDWLSTSFLNLIEFTERSLLLRLRNEFSKLFSQWFKFLVPEESFQVNLDETFTPLIIQNQVEMEYAFLSGGERTAVALAYRLALNQTINSILSKIKTHDIVILDEPTDGFSDAQIDKIRDVLDELNISQLIIVSHEQKIESFVDNIIRIKKSSGISELETSQTSQVSQIK
ncbi:hypothetical protein CMI47_04330 [Candidatus Pacearchaeota archaeon]|nr:hypothetical protein [Candidatus Pacearchaeota archaeon]|tara:strand:- start:4687 stop:6765 length:2079 start_codon:yes stop_codon:yes gene_type:complete